ncbi:putative membrane protein [Gottschalkia purinilytica]|uniref:Putative membrane protein n=1 Tax=Gottschalkia purinilytica TaxID=1503 RepID=A0A0L0WE68_GOTPU|nr:zinc ribbon domain-containing protein [Gottschalkia purinilytica]KNF09764.1 putative membrane protein [Gottschalkia purinilytica]
MFCHRCGQSNDDYSNYCSKDGIALRGKKLNVRLSKKETKFCKDCGSKTEKSDLYCNSCGQSLFEVKEKKSINKIPNVTLEKTSLLYSLKTSGISFAIILIINIIISLLGNKTIDDAIVREIGPFFSLDYINFIDFTLISNFIKLKLISGVGKGVSGELSYQGGVLILAIIPFFVFCIIGILNARKDCKNSKEFCIKNSLLISLFYGLILGILTMFGSGKFDIPLGIFDLNLVKKYSFLTAILNGFILSILFYLIGYGIYIKFRRKNEIIERYKYLFNGLLTLFTGYIVSFTLFLLFINRTMIDTYSGFVDKILTLQMPSYIWYILNFNTFHVNDGNMLQSFSVINTEELRQIFDSTGMGLIYVGLIISFMLFFAIGIKMKKSSKGNLVKDILYFSISYSLFMIAFVLVSNIKVQVSGSVSNIIGRNYEGIFVGFKVIGTFIKSFAFSFVATFSGSLIGKEKSTQEVEAYE